MQETGAEVIGVDWRIPLDQAWQSMGHQPAVQGNLDPVTLFAGWEELRRQAEAILIQANGRPGHIFNLGHGILPHTPVENVKQLAAFVKERSAALRAQAARHCERPSQEPRKFGRSDSRQAILLLAHGSPDRVEDIAEYLRNVTGGRPLPEPVVREVEQRYRLIGRSPLTEITLRQAQGVSRESGLPVYVGMRNWRPYIADTVRQMAEDGITRAVVICLAPHNSRTSVGLYRRALGGASVENAASPPFTIDFVESWHDHPLLIKAFAQRLREGWQRACGEAAAGFR